MYTVPKYPTNHKYIIINTIKNIDYQVYVYIISTWSYNTHFLIIALTSHPHLYNKVSNSFLSMLIFCRYYYYICIYISIYVCNVPQTTTWMNVSCAYIINLTTCDRINIIWNCILSIISLCVWNGSDISSSDWPTCYALM